MAMAMAVMTVRARCGLQGGRARRDCGWSGAGAAGVREGGEAAGALVPTLPETLEPLVMMGAAEREREGERERERDREREREREMYK